MKPTWGAAPDWAEYLAMDEDGEWSWYEEEPDRLWQHGVWVGAGSCELAQEGNDGIYATWAESLETKKNLIEMESVN